MRRVGIAICDFLLFMFLLCLCSAFDNGVRWRIVGTLMDDGRWMGNE